MVSCKKFLDTVEENEFATRKEGKRLLIKLFLLVIPLALAITIMTSALVNFILALFALILGVATFIGLLDYAIDNEVAYKHIRLVSKFWIVGIPGLVGIILFLHLGMGVI